MSASHQAAGGSAAHESGTRLPAVKTALLLSAVALIGCASHPPMPAVDRVDLERFMGDWYVIANIPTFLEKNAYNAVESYRLEDDGTIETTFTFRKGSFDGPLKEYNPRGFVRDTDSNAVWGMRFVWPFKADYRIIYLDEDYSLTVIGRVKRDYVWVMARQPTIESAEYDRMVRLIEAAGYDVSEIRRVPQQW